MELWLGSDTEYENVYTQEYTQISEYQLQLQQVQTNLSIPYRGVGDTEHAFYVAILLCGLEERHIELPILLDPLSVTSRPVLVTHFLQGREASRFTSVVTASNEVCTIISSCTTLHRRDCMEIPSVGYSCMCGIIVVVQSAGLHPTIPFSTRSDSITTTPHSLSQIIFQKSRHVNCIGA